PHPAPHPDRGQDAARDQDGQAELAGLVEGHDLRLLVPGQQDQDRPQPGFRRPQKTIQLDGNYFFAGSGGNHELKFGTSWKQTSSSSATIYSGNKTRAIFNTNLQDRARFYRDTVSEDVAQY